MKKSGQLATIFITIAILLLAVAVSSVLAPPHAQRPDGWSHWFISTANWNAGQLAGDSWPDFYCHCGARTSSLGRSANYVVAVEIIYNHQAYIRHQERNVFSARVIKTYVDIHQHMLAEHEIIEIVDVHGITFNLGDRLLLFLRYFLANDNTVMFFLVNPTQSAYFYTPDFESFVPENPITFTQYNYEDLIFLRNQNDRWRRWPYAHDLEELADWASHVFRVEILDSRREVIRYGGDSVDPHYEEHTIYRSRVLEVLRQNEGHGFMFRFPREVGDIIDIAGYYRYPTGLTSEGRPGRFILRHPTFAPGSQYILYLTFEPQANRDREAIQLFYLINSTQGKILME